MVARAGLERLERSEDLGRDERIAFFVFVSGSVTWAADNAREEELAGCRTKYLSAIKVQGLTRIAS